MGILKSLAGKGVAWIAGRWVTALVVTLLFSGAGLLWHNYKDSLINRGVQECKQEITEQQMQALADALAEEQAAAAELRASLEAVAVINQEAVERRQVAEAKLRTLAEQMRPQREEDETYRTWADTDLPVGVADRLRQAARGQASASDNDN
jgi:hypothetical protein